MLGLLFFFILGLWALVLFCLGYFLSFPIKHKGIRLVIGILVAVFCYQLPVRDELKGKEEFEALCKTGGVYQISPKAEGKKFDLISQGSPKKRLSGFSIPIEEMNITYTDAATGEVIATVNAYFAKGGWLVQHGFGLMSQTNPLFVRSQCFPSDKEAARIQRITNKIVN
ncbi:MAG: hypothetical protein WCB36_14155 [Burkholderiales bacterium]